MSKPIPLPSPPLRRVSSLRGNMPTVAAWVDQLREAFGKAEIDAAIRAGQRGEAGFYATEGSHAIGMPFMDDSDVWHGEGITSRHYCSGCAGQCVGTDRCCTPRQDLDTAQSRIQAARDTLA